ncbi:MAG TPA: hypothetical protein VK640_00820 [Actinomycetes bacterium]|nr:hypothetical protein [Actinomycetes bacterium]
MPPGADLEDSRVEPAESDDPDQTIVHDGSVQDVAITEQSRLGT